MTAPVQINQKAQAEQIAQGALPPKSQGKSKRVNQDVLEELVPLFSDEQEQTGAAKDPLFYAKPNKAAQETALPPLSGYHAYTLFDAINSMKEMFKAQTAMADSTMNILSVVGGMIHQMMEQTDIYTGQMNETQQMIQAIEAKTPAWLRWLEDAFMAIVGVLFSAVTFGAGAAVAAVIVTVVMTVMSSIKVKGKDGKEENLWGALFQDMGIENMPWLQMVFKLVIAIGLGALCGGASMFTAVEDSAETVAETAAEDGLDGAGDGADGVGAGDIELNDMANVEQDDVGDVEDIANNEEADANKADAKEQSKIEKLKEYVKSHKFQPNGKRFLYITSTNALSSASSIKTAYSDKDQTELGFWGDILHAAGVSDAAAAGIGGVIGMATSVISSIVGGKLALGQSVSNASSLMRVFPLLLSALGAVVSVPYGIASGVYGFEIGDLILDQKKLAGIIDNAQKDMAQLEYLQSSGEQMTEATNQQNKHTMNAVWAALTEAQVAVGIRQPI